MIDLTWKVFSQTGNIETYLLMKQIENESDSSWREPVTETENKEVHSVDGKI